MEVEVILLENYRVTSSEYVRLLHRSLCKMQFAFAGIPFSVHL